MVKAQEKVPVASRRCCVHGVTPTMEAAWRACRLSPPTAAAQHTTAPIMIAATAPIGESRPSNSTSTSEANRIVAMVMPETGLLDEPTSPRSEEHTSELQSLMRISYAVFCLKKKNSQQQTSARKTTTPP